MLTIFVGKIKQEVFYWLRKFKSNTLINNRFYVHGMVTLRSRRLVPNLFYRGLKILCLRNVQNFIDVS